MTHFGVPRRSFAAKTEEVQPLNWRRGMFRLWLLFSAAWMMSWIIYLAMYGIRSGFKAAGDVIVIPVLLFGPPIALFLFGLAAGWAFRGFKSDAANKPSQ